MQKLILGIDPGPKVCGWAILHPDDSVDAGIADTEQMIYNLPDLRADKIAIEVFEPRGMRLGKESIETILATGRMFQRAKDARAPIELIRRSAVKSALCNTQRAKDKDIRRAIIDLYGGADSLAIGRKRAPGPLYGVTSHAWAALAVAITARSLL